MVGKKGPFGGFCNYGIFGIWGKNPETGKKKYKKVDAAGFDAILKQSGGFYKVQTGAYSKKENANAEVAKLKAKGFDAIVTTNGGSAAGSANSEIKVGDVVQFSGGPHYGSAAASTAAGTPKVGPVFHFAEV